MYYSTTYSSPVGGITLACDSDGGRLVGLWIEGQKYHGEAMTEVMEENGNIPLFHAAIGWLDRYFAGGRPSLCELPLAPAGSEFRQGVWSIPVSYTHLDVYKRQLFILSEVEAGGIPSVAVKCVNIRRNTSGEGGLLGFN